MTCEIEVTVFEIEAISFKIGVTLFKIEGISFELVLNISIFTLESLKIKPSQAHL